MFAKKQPGQLRNRLAEVQTLSSIYIPGMRESEIEAQFISIITNLRQNIFNTFVIALGRTTRGRLYKNLNYSFRG